MKEDEKILTGRTMMAVGVGLILAILISLVPKNSEKIIIVDKDDHDEDDAITILKAKRAKLKAKKDKANGRSKPDTNGDDEQDEPGDDKEGTGKAKEGQLPPEPKPDDKQPLAQ